jgi:oligoribonuclease (3'-5' exoribonuclease)
MKKLTDEELTKLKSLRERLVEIVTIIGEAHLNEYLAERQLEEIRQGVKTHEQSFDQFRQEERVLFDELQQKYGTGNIDLETGEIKD